MEILHTTLWSITLPIGNNCSFLYFINTKLRSMSDKFNILLRPPICHELIVHLLNNRGINVHNKRYQPRIMYRMRNISACRFPKYLEQVKESLLSVTECIWGY